jgi:hypothetical protein
MSVSKCCNRLSLIKACSNNALYKTRANGKRNVRQPVMYELSFTNRDLVIKRLNVCQ